MTDDRKQPLDGATAKDRVWESGSGGTAGRRQESDEAEGTPEAASNRPGAATDPEDETGGEPPCQGEFHG